MKTYCITGISGYLGSLLARKLVAQSDQNQVIGIDLKAPEIMRRLKYYKTDIRGQELAHILKNEAVDVMIHLAFYTAPEGNPGDAYSINVDGTRNVFSAAKEASVKRLVLASSAAAYGSHEDNPIPIKETHPLRPNDFFYYSAHKAEQEELLKAFCTENPSVETIVLRPCIVIGPHINNQTGDSLKQKVLINFKDPEIPIQLIYEDDVADAFFLAATGRETGTFNVAAAGTLTYRDVGKILNKKVVLLPYKVLYYLASVAKVLRLSPVGGKTLQFIRNPVVLDSKKFNQAFNFTPRYDTAGALREFAKSSS